MMAKFQRGQSMVEFAVVLPFFLFVCGLMLVICLMFADYVQVQYEARSIARECSVLTREADKAEVVQKHRTNPPLLLLYNWQIKDSDVQYHPPKDAEKAKGENGTWTVILEVQPQDTDKGLWALAVDVAKDNIPPIRATCTMYSENDLSPQNNAANEPIRR